MCAKHVVLNKYNVYKQFLQKNRKYENIRIVHDCPNIPFFTRLAEGNATKGFSDTILYLFCHDTVIRCHLVLKYRVPHNMCIFWVHSEIF